MGTFTNVVVANVKRPGAGAFTSFAIVSVPFATMYVAAYKAQMMPKGFWKTKLRGFLRAFNVCVRRLRRRDWFKEDFSTIALFYRWLETPSHVLMRAYLSMIVTAGATSVADATAAPTSPTNRRASALFHDCLGDSSCILALEVIVNASRASSCPRIIFFPQ